MVRELEEILLVSNDQTTVEFFKDVLKDLDLQLVVKNEIRASLKCSKDRQIIFIDCEIADGTCIECLESMVSLNSGIIPVAILEEGNRELRIEALQNGAFSSIFKPLNRKELIAVLKRATKVKQLEEMFDYLENLTIEEFLKEKVGNYLGRFKEIERVSIYDTVLCEVERALLKIAMDTTGGNKSEASKLLGLNRNTLRNKIKKYKIK
jgi:DNA-binding NtrC family response regulator